MTGYEDGTVSLVVVGAGGDAFERSQLRGIENHGATHVLVAPGVDSEGRYFTREDLIDIQETVSSTGIVTIHHRRGKWQRRSGTVPMTISYVGSAEMLRLLHTIDRGEIPLNWRRGVVLSDDFAVEHDLEPGDRLWLRRSGDGRETPRPYRVVAVLAESTVIGGSDIYMPIRVADERRYTRIRILTDSTTRAEATAAKLRADFNRRKSRLFVYESTRLLRLYTSIANGVGVFLVGVSVISLIVAGVAIANTMLMSVIRRREEIGIHRAVGYQRGDIVRILLAEATVLSGIGSTAGVATALPLVMFANDLFLGDPFSFSTAAIGYVVAAFGFSVVTGITAGIYPAWRAVTVPPVEALQD